MLDILSKGRVDFGVGKGATVQEAGAFEVEAGDIDGQLEESFRMIPRMWRDDVFKHSGEQISVPPRQIHPSPHREPTRSCS